MTKIASHRGGTHLWPENSRLAFRQTAALPVELVEFDVHHTADKVLVVHHDATIDRMTDGKGEIGRLTYDQLSKFVIVGAAGETIPTLDEVIDIFAPSPVDLRLEIKTRPDGTAYEGMEEAIVERLVASGMLSRCMVTSFSLERLDAFRKALEAAGRNVSELLGFVWLCSPAVIRQVGWIGVDAALAAYRVFEIGIRAEMISVPTIAPLSDRGVIIHGWAAHDIEMATRMFDLGIASFTTDRPDIAIATRAKQEMR
ncbi:glycerophosphodiester phosphodiesterase family protein [Neorhizobium sp. T25_27]|uniref:glycerophosphodiester phosphodiesterase family protein n=1 Tax=Neorhizobium sp. T25_27 TaxID=2093831 RepID=UPI000CF8FAD8|nr:glycerophosphodiester phosphodiesterase family protein [Neorhizobium sp. T25_27]